MNNLKANLQNVRARVARACEKAGRDPAEVMVLAVSKKHTPDRIRELHALGQRSFGENYVQEALAKQAQLGALDIEWHFIGPLQSNKTREAAEHFAWVQSVDRAKIARRLADQRPPDLPPLDICIQVNIDREPQKAGVLPEEARELARFAQDLPNVRLRGLMAIPRMVGEEYDPSDSYRRLRELFLQIRDGGIPMDTLSMGMSADLELAVLQGSTMVRIGTDLLGPRPDGDSGQ
jgi:hypothetical protein